MKIKHELIDGVCVVTMLGNLALDLVPVAKTYLRPLIENEEVKAVLINCENINIIDSNGYGFLTSVLKMLKSSNRGFALSGLNRRNMEVVTTIGLNRIMHCTATQEEAMDLIVKELQEAKEA